MDIGDKVLKIYDEGDFVIGEIEKFDSSCDIPGTYDGAFIKVIKSNKRWNGARHTFIYFKRNCGLKSDKGRVRKISDEEILVWLI